MEPMASDYHPELEESEVLNSEKIKVYQMMIGCPQWAVTLGRYDIQYATNTLARYGSCPKEGHLKGIIRVFGYLKHHRKHRIMLNAEKPNYNRLVFQEYDWTHHYRYAKEELPPNMPKPITEEAYITVYIDASHANDLVTWRSVTGVLLIINKAPVKWVQ